MGRAKGCGWKLLTLVGLAILGFLTSRFGFKVLIIAGVAGLLLVIIRFISGRFGSGGGAHLS